MQLQIIDQTLNLHSHSAIELLKTLNKDELKSFGDYIRSPFFNNRDTLIRLYEILLKHAPDYKSNIILKQNLYKKLYPGKAYNEQTLRSRMSEFSVLLKSFLTQKRYMEDEFAQKKYFIDELIKRKKFELSEKYISEIDNSLMQTRKFGKEFFRNRHTMLTQLAELRIAKDEEKESLESAYERSESLLNYFFLEFLKANNDIICFEIQKQEKREFSFAKLFTDKFNFEEYINILKERQYEYYPLIATYYYGNLSLLKPDEEYYFYQLKDLIYRFYKEFDLDELYNYWALLSNSAYVNYLNKGKKFIAEGNEINKFFIENKIYDENKPFSALGYQNILMNAIMANDLAWGEKFIDEFKDKLPKESVDNRYNFCKALIYFERSEYEKSISHLSSVKYTDWELNLGSRLIILKNYYEMGLPSQVETHIDSFRHFISKNIDKLPTYAEEKIKNTLNYIGKISGAKFGGKKLDFGDLKEAENNENFFHKKWILNKMKELIEAPSFIK